MVGRPALDELYGAAYRRLVVQLYAICGDLSDAEDAVQEGFVAWVRTTAINHLRGRWRHAAVVRKYQPRVPGPQAPIEIGPEYVAIVTALAQVDAGQREVVVLHYLGDMGTAQIAAELGIAEGTVKSRLSRAREKLAGLLDDKEERHV